MSGPANPAPHTLPATPVPHMLPDKPGPHIRPACSARKSRSRTAGAESMSPYCRRI